jgi:hypothetical protein
MGKYYKVDFEGVTTTKDFTNFIEVIEKTKEEEEAYIENGYDSVVNGMYDDLNGNEMEVGTFLFSGEEFRRISEGFWKTYVGVIK